MSARDILLEPAPPARPHSLADAGGLAVLVLTLGLFLAPALLWVMLDPSGLPTGTHLELRTLAACACLALVLPLVQIVLQNRQLGGPAVRGNRARFPAERGAGGRVARAHRNLVESLVPFGAAVLAATAPGISTPLTVAASGTYLAARLVHALTYGFGITVLRSAAFYAGLAATAAILSELPLLG